MPYKEQEQQRSYSRSWIAARRRKYARGKSCAQCGSRHRLQVDHIDPRKKIDHRIWSWSQPRLEAELAKCQWLCASCHQEKTNRDSYPPRVHGTRTMYQKGKCRCVACRDANAKYASARRKALASRKSTNERQLQ